MTILDNIPDETFDLMVKAFQTWAAYYERNKDDIDIDAETLAEDCVAWIMKPLRDQPG